MPTASRSRQPPGGAGKSGRACTGRRKLPQPASGPRPRPQAQPPCFPPVHWARTGQSPPRPPARPGFPVRGLLFMGLSQLHRKESNLGVQSPRQSHILSLFTGETNRKSVLPAQEGPTPRPGLASPRGARLQAGASAAHLRGAERSLPRVPPRPPGSQHPGPAPPSCCAAPQPTVWPCPHPLPATGGFLSLSEKYYRDLFNGKSVGCRGEAGPGPERCFSFMKPCSLTSPRGGSP